MSRHHPSFCFRQTVYTMFTSSILLLQILFLIDTFLLRSHSSSAAITIDIDKGVILRPVGFYSDEVEEQIFHVLIPFNNLCIEAPHSDMCAYTRSEKFDLMKVETVVSQSSHLSSMYDKKNVSNIVERDILRVLFNHQVDKFLAATHSIVYFINEHFYLDPIDNRSALVADDASSSRNRQLLQHPMAHPASLVLQQVFRRQVGFDFLTDDLTAAMLSLIVTSDPRLFNTANTKQKMKTFIELIKGQSVFVLNGCSTIARGSDRATSSCLAVSTVIRKLPSETSSIYQVYRAIPLPVSFEGHQYVYEDVPQVFGYNSLSKNVVLWNDNEVTTSCRFSAIVQCPTIPITMDLASLPCLSELFDAESSSVSRCQVIKSNKDLQMNVLNVDANLWYFYAPVETLSCQLNSPLGTTTDVAEIRPPMLVSFPCNRDIQCLHVQLPAAECIDQSVYLRTKNNLTMNEQSLISLSLPNITHRLLSIHDRAAKSSFIQLQTAIDESRPMLNRILEDFLSCVISSLSFLLFSISMLIIRYIKNKTINRAERMQTEINRIKRDLIDEV